MPTIEIFLLSVFRFIVSIFDLWLVWVENICNNIKKSNFTKPLSKKIVIRELFYIVCLDTSTTLNDIS